MYKNYLPRQIEAVNKITEITKAKKDKNFTLADQIRKDLMDQGILIEDQKDKTVWKLK